MSEAAVQTAAEPTIRITRAGEWHSPSTRRPMLAFIAVPTILAVLVILGTPDERSTVTRVLGALIGGPIILTVLWFLTGHWIALPFAKRAAISSARAQVRRALGAAASGPIRHGDVSHTLSPNGGKVIGSGSAWDGERLLLANDGVVASVCRGDS